LMQFKNAGGWHSDRVCQEYLPTTKLVTAGSSELCN
jgi:hypothetical protein